MIKTEACRVCGKVKEFTNDNYILKNGKLYNWCKECKREYNINYNKENKEKIKEANKKRWQENKEKEKERVAKWRGLNKEHIKKYRQLNKERDKEQTRKWRIEGGRELERQRCNRRRARIKELKNDFTTEEWEYCKSFFDYKCCYCGNKTALEQEHFIPLSKQGEYTKGNILPSCRSCNASKNDTDFKEWYIESGVYSEQREGRIYDYFRKFL